MKQGIITNNRVRLLLPKGSIGCKGLKMKEGEKKRKSIRGSIVSPEISVLNLIVIKEGNTIDGLSRKDIAKKKILPKRASKIRKIFNLNKRDDLRKFITQNKNIYQNKSQKFPKIQRLITPLSIQKKRSKISFKKERKEKSKIEMADHGKFLCR
jgi:small subunit ribosomal protein S6e